jgi:hypothetical protein
MGWWGWWVLTTTWWWVAVLLLPLCIMPGWLPSISCWWPPVLPAVSLLITIRGLAASGSWPPS